MLRTLDEVEHFARMAHRGQRDKGNEPYSIHIGTVAHGVAMFGVGAQMAGWLHDVVEDTRTTFHDLESQGLPLGVLDAVRLLTKERSLDYKDNIRRVLPNYTACLVKLADNAHNSQLDRLAVLERETRNRLEAKYFRARALLLPNLAAADAAEVLRRVNPLLLGEIPGYETEH